MTPSEAFAEDAAKQIAKGLTLLVCAIEAPHQHIEQRRAGSSRVDSQADMLYDAERALTQGIEEALIWLRMKRWEW